MGVLRSKQVDITPDLDHIANAGYYVKKVDKKNYYKVVTVNGGHLAGSVKELEKIGLVVIKEEKMLKYGCKHYVVEDLLTGKTIQKTEFPKSWNTDKIMEAIIESFDNLTKPDKTLGKRITRFCRSNHGLELQLIIDETDTGYKLVTAIPYFE